MKTASFRTFYLKKLWFFTLKTAVLSVRNGGFSLKKRRFLKLIFIFVGIKTVYHSDYQLLVCNAKNKRLSSTKDSVLSNIGCMCGQNRHFVKFIHNGSSI